MEVGTIRPEDFVTCMWGGHGRRIFYLRGSQPKRLMAEAAMGDKQSPIVTRSFPAAVVDGFADEFKVEEATVTTRFSALQHEVRAYWSSVPDSVVGRFLVAVDMDIERARKSFSSYWSTRATLFRGAERPVETPGAQIPRAINDELDRMGRTGMLEALPGQLWGRDADGHVVIYVDVGRCFSRIADGVHSGRVTEDELVRGEAYRMLVLERILEADNRAEAWSHQRYMGVYDMRGVTMTALWKVGLRRAVSFVGRLLHHATTVFPELVMKSHVINAPAAFTTIFALVRPLMSKRTASKVCVGDGPIMAAWVPPFPGSDATDDSEYVTEEGDVESSSSARASSEHDAPHGEELAVVGEYDFRKHPLAS